MEASTGVPSPLAGRKMPRPAYKAMWETQCKIAADWSHVASDLSRYREEDAEAIREQTRLADRWFRIAVAEGGALVAVALILWLR